MRIIAISMLILSSGNLFADDKKICEEFLKMETELNKSLPRNVDEFTELIQFSVNCETEVLKYTRRVFPLFS